MKIINLLSKITINSWYLVLTFLRPGHQFWYGQFVFLHLKRLFLAESQSFALFLIFLESQEQHLEMLQEGKKLIKNQCIKEQRIIIKTNKYILNAFWWITDLYVYLLHQQYGAETQPLKNPNSVWQFLEPQLCNSVVVPEQTTLQQEGNIIMVLEKSTQLSMSASSFFLSSPSWQTTKQLLSCFIYFLSHNFGKMHVFTFQYTSWF